MASDCKSDVLRTTGVRIPPCPVKRSTGPRDRSGEPQGGSEASRGARARVSDRGGYRFNGWSLECRTRRLVNPDGAPVLLTNSEYALLLAFLKAPQRPLTREMLLQATRVREDIFDRSIDVQVLRLRRKLEIDPNAPRVIETERGVGYILTAIVKPF